MARILVVDDDPSITSLVRIALARTGHEVETAKSGDEALECARRARPDLILLDLMMPGMSGSEVLEEIRADPELADIRVVLATGEPDACTHLDVLAVLAKPYKLDELLDTVCKAIGDQGETANA